jgi:hypothetical protein
LGNTARRVPRPSVAQPAIVRHDAAIMDVTLMIAAS